ncbi:hypothetical protein ACLBR5_11095 [Escherichia coli]
MQQNRRYDFAVALFVASGFEHCIANLFVIPFAIAIRHFAHAPSATGAQ